MDQLSQTMQAGRGASAPPTAAERQPSGDPRPSPGAARSAAAESPENQLLQARLGIASSLFTALRFRHPPTASHSLRVTLSCASWALAMGMSEEQRDLIEVAWLRHDVGKIGVPVPIGLMPERRTAVEFAVRGQYRLLG
ncbi:MAG: HD-GYP domain-containing protein, partial [Pirellulales bacterium]